MMQNGFNYNYFQDVMKQFDPSKISNFFTKNNPFYNESNNFGNMSGIFEKAGDNYHKFVRDISSNNPVLNYFQEQLHKQDHHSKMHDFFSKSMSDFSEATLEAARNFQDMVKERMVTLHNHATEIYESIKQVFSVQSPDLAVSLQAELAKKHMENIVSDYQKLNEMLANSSIESFEKVSSGLSKAIADFQEIFQAKSHECQSNKCDASKKESKK